MDTSSLIIILTPTMTLITLLTGIALPFIAGSRSGRSRATPAGYLYVPCIRIRYHGSSAELRRWVQEVPIVKQTAKCIYYTSDSWDRREAVVSPGCISRDEFETDTRCHDHCPRNMTAGLVCAAHGRGHRHCVHVLAPGRRCHEPGGCGDDCQAGIRGWRCAKHGYTWEHCPHGEDRCRHGYPAGVIPVPGARSGSAGALLRHPPGRRGQSVPRGRRASRTRGTARTFCQGAAPRHGRRSPRPWRHDRAVHRRARRYQTALRPARR